MSTRPIPSEMIDGLVQRFSSSMRQDMFDGLVERFSSSVRGEMIDDLVKRFSTSVRQDMVESLVQRFSAAVRQDMLDALVQRLSTELRQELGEGLVDRLSVELRRELSEGLVDNMTSELRQELGGHLVQNVTSGLRQELGGIQIEVPQPPPPPPPVVHSNEPLFRSARAIRQAAGQTEALRALLAGVVATGARGALFVARGNGFEGWECAGFENDCGDEKVVAGVPLDIRHGAILRAISNRQPVTVDDNSSTGGVPSFGQELHGEATLYPLVLQDRVAAMLYADPQTTGKPADTAAIGTLVELTCTAVERQAFARAVARSTSDQPGASAASHLSGPHPMAAAPYNPPAPMHAPPVAAASPTFSAPAVASAAPPASTASFAPLAQSVAAAVPALGTSSATPQRPPSAAPFELSMPQATPAASSEIEDARRFARLLMEEIYLYHSDKVEQGRAAKDIQAQLGDELHKARAIYEERFSAAIRGQGDFFEEAIVRVLAAGDASALGTAQHARS